MRPTSTIQFRKKCRIGRYQYDPNSLIGIGCYGKVYKGLRFSDGFEVAVKVVDLNLHPDQEASKFVQNQLKIHQILKHQKVIHCLEIFQKNNIFYFITEYFPQGDLENYLKTKGSLTQYQALAYLHQIIQGLVHLKEKKVIHRDIKPANIFIKAGGEVVLADFGLSIICQNEIFCQELRIGTPRYMAPQTLKQGIYSHKCDVWSLGSLFIEMLMGEAPLARCDSFEEITERVTGAMIPSTIRISTECRNMLESILQVCQKKRISIEELYSHSAFDILNKKQFCSQTTDCSEIQIEDISFYSKTVFESFIGASTVNSVFLSFEQTHQNPFVVQSTPKLLHLFNQFIENIEPQSSVRYSLESIYQRLKSSGGLGRMDYKLVMDKSKQVVEQLRGRYHVDAQMEAINVSYFRSVLEENQKKRW